jgi:DNA polymerase-3 subunit delta'
VSDGEDGADAPHPRDTTALFGHETAENALLEAYRSGRFAHAWLIGGPPGIGKATLAYRMARFVLAHPDATAPAVRRATSLAVAADHPVSRKIAAQGHPDLLVLERGRSDSGALRSTIAVDDVRRTVGFFGATAGEGGWRVCLVDAVDDLNAAGANALLKILEDPPARALFLLISHAPGRVLPTIRSRCRRLMLRPLEERALAQALAAAGQAPEEELAEIAAFADGSVARALSLADTGARAMRRQVGEALEKLPAVDPLALHRVGDALGRGDDAAYEAFIGTVRDWLSQQLHAPPAEPARLARVAEVWEKVNRAAREAEVFNLERKPLVFAVFGHLAEAVRR